PFNHTFIILHLTPRKIGGMRHVWMCPAAIYNQHVILRVEDNRLSAANHSPSVLLIVPALDALFDDFLGFFDVTPTFDDRAVWLFEVFVVGEVVLNTFLPIFTKVIE